MSSRRFELLMQFLHLNNSALQNGDRLYKIRPIMDCVIENFMKSYIPHREISIDESIIAYKGRLSWIQYLPKKPHKWGLKAWVLADATNGYVWNWRLYTGKEPRTDGVCLSHHVVLSLSSPLKGKGYEIYCDNFYSSPQLFATLLEEGFGACGTVRSNRKGLSKAFKTVKLKKGEVHSEKAAVDDSVLCLKWMDKRAVTLLSTLHDDTMVDVQRRSRGARGGVESIQKPRMIDEYNKHMGGVDLSDQLVLYYGYSHRQIKWWKRGFFHLIDLALVNSNIMYNSVNKQQLTQMDFRIAVAKGLLEGHTRQQAQHYNIAPQLPTRLTERPFIERIPNDTPYGGRPRCEVCRAQGKKRSQTQYRCKVCKVPLHLEQCFEQYHTKLRYEKN